MNPKRINLPPRQAEIAKLVRVGCPRKKIAGQLGISVRTVQGHLERLRWKFKATTTPELIFFLNRHYYADK
jgi:DNA-binding CsgD family transcriptional regulator